MMTESCLDKQSRLLYDGPPGFTSLLLADIGDMFQGFWCLFAPIVCSIFDHVRRFFTLLLGFSNLIKEDTSALLLIAFTGFLALANTIIERDYGELIAVYGED
ncbi:hypothetical protein ACOME3_003722 [Neoechinorhynchus agilis]